MLKLATIASALKLLREVVGVPVIWKTLDMRHIPSGELGEAFYHHCGPFCLGVKEGYRERCGYQESDGLLITAEEEPGGFVKTCHAGVSEVVMPIVDGNRTEGFLLAGPFRTFGVECPYAEYRSEYGVLPEFDSERIAALRALLAITARGLAGLRLLLLVREARDPRIRKAQAYMRSHFRDRLTAADVAARCGLSESRLVHLLTQETGISFSNFIIDLRIDEAKHLLVEGRQTKGEIAGTCGFSDQSHFSATFKRRTGQTPGQFQKSWRNEMI